MDVRPGSFDDLAPMTDALGRAFRHRPISNFMCSADLQDQGILLPFYRAYLGVALSQYAVIQVGNPAIGVAVWEPPDADRVADERWATSGIDAFFASIGDEATARWKAFLARLGEVQARLRPARSWYLTSIGVVPEHQGMGAGQALLRWGVERAAAEGVAAYLETNEAVNVPFYERGGFRVLEFEEFGERRFPIWYMMTDPPAKP
jgi:ribosomal protein S18 acetylase RimI-like enzyme